MSWPFTVIALVLAIHVLISTQVLKSRARSMAGWNIAFFRALGGQFVVSAIALVPAIAIATALLSNAAAEKVSFTLGVVAFLLLWMLGQAALVSRWARREQQKFVAPWFSARISSGAFATVLVWNAFAWIIGVAAWQFSDRLPHAVGTAVDTLLREIVERASGKPKAAIARGGTLDEQPAGTVAAGVDGAKQRESQVIAAIHAWSAAWSRKEIAAYLDAYAPELRLPHGQSRREWEALRSVRMEKPKRISVRISSPEVAFTDAVTATIRFRQHYDSDLVSDTTRKTLVMKLLQGRWKILEERADPGG